ncbi:hypothetical protein AWB99_01940 [Mycolicibacterium confluentis]|nr:hypothetical protein AWB99_01940 [Mycolicibacterium confluentis]
MSAHELVDRLDGEGFVCLPGVVAPQWLEDARASVSGHLAAYGVSDFCIIRPDSDSQSPAHRFVSDPAVHGLLRELAELRWPRGVAESETIFSVLRVLAGPQRMATSHAFHFDAAVVTMLVPLIIPEAGAGRSGELVVFPNRRPFRRSALLNLVEKLWTESRLRRGRILREVRSAPTRCTVQLQPGSVYLFWGYRTLHGNLPCAPDTVRATLLVHFGDPHRTSRLIASARALRRRLWASIEHTEATVVRF